MSNRREIQEFEIGETIGVGTVGTIYRAWDTKHEREVALKVLLPSISSQEVVRRRFWREMMVLERLNDPHIIKYFGGGRDETQLFYAMELVDGGTLKEVLEKSGRLAWQEVVTCGTQISSALQHAHNQGVIHRDLKPSNLLLTKQGQLKLGDFGIARDAQDADITDNGLTVGTYAYMSPEQIIGDRNISEKTDLYALGCLLFELLAGRPPFEGENFAQLFEQHLRTPPPHVRDFAPDCPADLDALIQQLMAKNPDDRPFNARAVYASLMRLGEQDSKANVADGDSTSAAGDLGREALSRRIQRVASGRTTSDISWVSLACLLVAVVGIVCAACYFGN
jgi:serine/threonine protein kinase